MGAQTSIVKKVSNDITNNFLQQTMNSMSTCDAAMLQTFSQNLSADGNITVTNQTIDITGLQQLSCLASQDLQTLMDMKFKSELTSNVAAKVAGIPLGMQTSVDSIAQSIVNTLTSNTNISLIQKIAVSATQSAKIDKRAVGNITITNESISMGMTQIIETLAEQVSNIIQSNATSTSTTSSLTSTIDGMMSGSTFTYIAMVIGIIAVLAVLAGVFKFIMASRNQSKGMLLQSQLAQKQLEQQQQLRQQLILKQQSLKQAAASSAVAQQVQQTLNTPSK